jgi:hypothetical protein
MGKEANHGMDTEINFRFVDDRDKSFFHGVFQLSAKKDQGTREKRKARE